MMKTITAGQVMRGFPLPMMALALILVLGAFGCSPAAAPGATVGPVPEELTVGLGEDVTYFSAIRIGGNPEYLTRNVYESLLNLDTDGKAIAGLASSWKVSPDGKSYEFKLRKGDTYVN